MRKQKAAPTLGKPTRPGRLFLQGVRELKIKSYAKAGGGNSGTRTRKGNKTKSLVPYVPATKTPRWARKYASPA